MASFFELVPNANIPDPLGSTAIVRMACVSRYVSWGRSNSRGLTGGRTSRTGDLEDESAERGDAIMREEGGREWTGEADGDGGGGDDGDDGDGDGSLCRE